MDIHLPSPETTGLPVEEGEKKKLEPLASVDSANKDLRADEPGEAQPESNWAKTGHNGGITALAMRLHK